MPKCVSTVYLSEEREHVPCGVCLFCLQNKRQDWQFRLEQEMKSAESAHFLTLTYNKENLPLMVDTETGEFEPTLDKKDMQLFMKRLRKNNLNRFMALEKNFATRKEASKAIAPLRYYTVGEYGGQFGRPHYHSIMFNLQPDMEKKLDKIWSNGFVDCGTVTPASIAYVCGYSINRFYHKKISVKPFANMSLKPALGYQYLKNKKYHVQNETTQVKTNGTSQRLPRFYKEKFFSDYQKNRMGQKNYLLSIKNANTEDERIIKLGNEPDKYNFDKIKETLRKLEIKNLKSQKL